MTRLQSSPVSGADRGFGLGFRITRYRGVRLLCHEGGNPGIAARLCIEPERELAVAVLVNRDSLATPVNVVNRILDVYLPRTSQDLEVHRSVRIIGTYHPVDLMPDPLSWLEPFMHVQVREDPGGLRVELGDSARCVSSLLGILGPSSCAAAPATESRSSSAQARRMSCTLTQRSTICRKRRAGRTLACSEPRCSSSYRRSLRGDSSAGAGSSLRGLASGIDPLPRKGACHERQRSQPGGTPTGWRTSRRCRTSPGFWCGGSHEGSTDRRPCPYARPTGPQWGWGRGWTPFWRRLLARSQSRKPPKSGERERREHGGGDEVGDAAPVVVDGGAAHGAGVRRARGRARGVRRGGVRGSQVDAKVDDGPHADHEVPEQRRGPERARRQHAAAQPHGGPAERRRARPAACSAWMPTIR